MSLQGGQLQGGQLGVAVGRVSPTQEQLDEWKRAKQERELREAAEQQGLHLVKCGVDVAAFDAPLDRRPHLLAAIHAIEDGQAEWFVMRDYERLAGESIFVQEELLARIWDANGRIYLTEIGEIGREHPDGNWERREIRMDIYVKTAQARYTLRRNRQRGHRILLEHGGYGGGQRYGRKYGFDLVPILGVNRYVVNDKEQEVIRWMCELRADGWTYEAIANEANGRGLRGSEGALWDRRRVGIMIKRGPHSGSRVIGATRQISAYGARAAIPQDSGALRRVS